MRAFDPAPLMIYRVSVDFLYGVYPPFLHYGIDPPSPDSVRHIQQRIRARLVAREKAAVTAPIREQQQIVREKGYQRIRWAVRDYFYQKRNILQSVRWRLKQQGRLLKMVCARYPNEVSGSFEQVRELLRGMRPFPWEPIR